MVEIIRPIESGSTEPFYCRLEDDQLYAVKGRQALPHGLMAEVYAGMIGTAMGLPVPPFAVADVSRSLLENFPGPSALQSLGEGPAFASLWQEPVETLAPSLVPLINRELLALTYFFDHWIGNGDRALTELGGNANLLYRFADKKVFVFDHNLAFWANYSSEELKTHVGNSAWKVCKGNQRFHTELLVGLGSAWSAVGGLENELPEEWLDGMPDFPEVALSFLRRVDTQEFWDELG